jgi:hypothetical protein
MTSVCVTYAVAAPSAFPSLPSFWGLAFLATVLWAIDGERMGQSRAKPARAGRVVKWGGLAFCIVVVAASFATLRYPKLYFGSTYHVYLGNGVLEISVLDGDSVLAAQWLRQNESMYRNGGRMCGKGWRAALNLRAALDQSGRSMHWTGRTSEGLMEHRFILPVWLLSLATLAATAVLWRRELRNRLGRGFPPGHCRRCGYDLTGNESGVCPECGTACETEEDPQ